MKCPHCGKLLRLMLWLWYPSEGDWIAGLWPVGTMRGEWTEWIVVCRACGEPVS